MGFSLSSNFNNNQDSSVEEYLQQMEKKIIILYAVIHTGDRDQFHCAIMNENETNIMKWCTQDL